jgi:transcriptional regulator with XRE-family HTH domain
VGKLISNIPALVKQYREEHKLSQKQLAELVRLALKEQGVDDSKFDDTFISRIENNKTTRIELGTVQKLMLVIKSINLGNAAVEEKQ